jgi:hypothetical protein
MAVWLGDEGLDESVAERLQRVGVDRVVVRRGSVDLAGQAPILRVNSVGEVGGAIPVGIALEVRGVRPGLDLAAAEAVWRAVEAELGRITPAELILDLPNLAEGLDLFITHLAEVSGLPVVPVLGFEQLQSEEGRRVAQAARSCVVPAFGTDGADLRGIGELDPLPLNKKLEPLVGSGVRVRFAIVLRPRTEPPLAGPGENLNSLTEGQATTVSTSSTLDRTFVFEKELEWSGQSWKAGDSLAIRWMDASKLNAALREIHSVVLPEIGGWDLVPLPAEAEELGLGREGLLRYLGGEGPEPRVEVGVERSGRTLRISLDNQSRFSSALSSFGNWVEVAVDAGRLVADDPGTFDYVALGSVRGGGWRQGGVDAVDAVRFTEVLLAGGEQLTSGQLRLPTSRSKVTVRWQIVLSDGREITGTVSR